MRIEDGRSSLTVVVGIFYLPKPLQYHHFARYFHHSGLTGSVPKIEKKRETETNGPETTHLIASSPGRSGTAVTSRNSSRADRSAPVFRPPQNRPGARPVPPASPRAENIILPPGNHLVTSGPMKIPPFSDRDLISAAGKIFSGSTSRLSSAEIS